METWTSRIGVEWIQQCQVLTPEAKHTHQLWECTNELVDLMVVKGLCGRHQILDLEVQIVWVIHSIGVARAKHTQMILSPCGNAQLVSIRATSNHSSPQGRRKRVHKIPQKTVSTCQSSRCRQTVKYLLGLSNTYAMSLTAPRLPKVVSRRMPSIAHHPKLMTTLGIRILWGPEHFPQHPGP